MILHLPDNTGYILHERADSFHARGTGFLSIKSFYGGEAHYTSGTAHHLAGEGSFLVLNHDQPYRVEIEADLPVESFCVFFSPEFARDLFHSEGQTLEQALEQPPAAVSVPAFFDRTYPPNSLVTPLLLNLRRACGERQPEGGWLVEHFHRLLENLLQTQAGAAWEAQSVPAARAATRVELYRRLHHARDYADAFFTGPIGISQMAEAAGLSTNHLLRTFRQVFHQTPYQYITARRLEHARALLLSSEQSVTEICLEVGFESLGSFSWLFRRTFGLSPQAYRAQKNSGPQLGDSEEAERQLEPYTG